MSEHLLAELERRTCRCMRCTLHAPAPRSTDMLAIVCGRCRCYRDLVRDRSSVFYLCERCLTRSAAAWPLSSVGTMLAELPRVPRVAAQPRRRAMPALDVDGARAVSILYVAEQLGIQVNRAGWGRCFAHDDRGRPNLHINPKKNAAFCNVCSRSWDTIALVMEIGGLSFADAVRELTRSSVAA